MKPADSIFGTQNQQLERGLDLFIYGPNFEVARPRNALLMDG